MSHWSTIRNLAGDGTETKALMDNLYSVQNARSGIGAQSRLSHVVHAVTARPLMLQGACLDLLNKSGKIPQPAGENFSPFSFQRGN
jgi:hypothetical protein